MLNDAQFCNQSLAFFNRLSSKPTFARKVAYDRFIRTLVLSGTWAKLDGLYLFAASDTNAAFANIVQSSFTCVPQGAGVTFTTDVGVHSNNALTNYLSTTFDPTVGSPNFTRNAASAFAFKAIDGGATDQGGLVGLDGNTYVNLYRPSGAFLFTCTGPGNTKAAWATNTGLMMVTRSSSSAIAVYAKGTTLYSGASASVALVAGHKLSFLFDQAGDGCLSTLAGGGYGGSLSAGDARTLSGAMQKYLDTIASGPVVGDLMSSSTILKNGTNNQAPGFARLNDGRLMATYSTTTNTAGVDCYIAYRTSGDTGKTWSDETVIATPATNGYTWYDGNCLTVLPNGKIVMASSIETNDFSLTHAYVFVGTVAGDLSISWNGPINVQGTNANPHTSAYALLLQDSRLMLPTYTYGGVGMLGIQVFFSSDGGLTWGGEKAVVSNTTAAGDNWTESNFVQLGSGTIVGLLRLDNSITPTRRGLWRTVSTDNGATFSSPAQAFDSTLIVEPARPGLVLSPVGTILLVSRFIGAASNYQTAVSYSTDAGVTWSGLVRYFDLSNAVPISYGDHVYSQGIYDARTASALYSIAQGNFTIAELDFQQFYLP